MVHNAIIPPAASGDIRPTSWYAIKALTSEAKIPQGAKFRMNELTVWPSDLRKLMVVVVSLAVLVSKLSNSLMRGNVVWTDPKC